MKCPYCQCEKFTDGNIRLVGKNNIGFRFWDSSWAGFTLLKRLKLHPPSVKALKCNECGHVALFIKE
jgi:hypothetical protein